MIQNEDRNINNPEPTAPTIRPSLDLQLKMTLDEYDVTDALESIPRAVLDLRETYNLIMLRAELDAWQSCTGNAASVVRAELRAEIRAAEEVIARAERYAIGYCRKLAAYVAARDAQAWQATR